MARLRENGHATEVDTSIEGEWSCYRGDHFKGRDNGHITEVASLKKREWSCYGGHFNGRENVTEVVTLMEEEWSCYRGGQFNGGRKVMLQRWSV